MSIIVNSDKLTELLNTELQEIHSLQRYCVSSSGFIGQISYKGSEYVIRLEVMTIDEARESYDYVNVNPDFECIQMTNEKLTRLDELKNKLLTTQHIKDNLQKQQLSVIRSIDETNLEIQKINQQIKKELQNELTIK